MVSILAVYHKKLKISTPWDEKKNFFDNILTTELPPKYAKMRTNLHF
jgi:hypothetical protein